MTIVGRKRAYFSQPLDAGKTYAYPVRVEMMHNGRKLEVSAKQRLVSGEMVQIEAVVTDGGRALDLRPAPGSSQTLNLQIDRPSKTPEPKVARN